MCASCTSFADAAEAQIPFSRHSRRNAGHRLARNFAARSATSAKARSALPPSSVGLDGSRRDRPTPFSIMDFFPTLARIAGGRVPDRPIDGVDQSDVLLDGHGTGRREHLLTFVGPNLVAARWKQVRGYFACVAPGRSGAGGATLLGGVGTSTVPMNDYPKVFNIEADPHEEHNISEMYEWVVGPLLKAVEEYKPSVAKYPNPPAANMTRF